MKVWELIAELNEFKAGAEVVLSVTDSNCTHIEFVEKLDEDSIHICGGEVQITDVDGNELGTLAENMPEIDA